MIFSPSLPLLRRAALALALPCAACASYADVESHGATTLRGRVGSRLVAEFDPGRATYSYDLPSGVLTADVLRVTNDYRHRRVIAAVEFNNRSDEPLHLAVADIALSVAGTRYGAKLTYDAEMPPLRPRTRQTVELTFELDAPPPAGIYPLAIAKVFPHPRSFPLDLRVPGTKTEPAGAPR